MKLLLVLTDAQRHRLEMDPSMRYPMKLMGASDVNVLAIDCKGVIFVEDDR